MLAYLLNHSTSIMEATFEHLILSFGAVLIAICIALPVGYLLYQYPKWSTPVLSFWSFIYVIPSLALFVLLIPYVGLGFKPVFITLILYSQISLTRSILTAFQGIESQYVEAAHSLGFSKWQQFRQVELPLALPIILGGIRVSLLTIMSIATLGAFVNGGGLGTLIFEGLNQSYFVKVAVGTIAIMILSLLTHIIFSSIEKKSTPTM